MRNKTVNRFTIEIEAKSANESFARIVAAGFASQLDPKIDELADIKTAVSEAVTNCIVHAYKNCGGKIKLSACYTDGRLLTVTVKDRGCGIDDVEKARQPLYTTLPGEDRCGMGFSIMESFSDRLTVSSKSGKGTKVTMIRRLSDPAPTT